MVAHHDDSASPLTNRCARCPIWRVVAPNESMTLQVNAPNAVWSLVRFGHSGTSGHHDRLPTTEEQRYTHCRQPKRPCCRRSLTDAREEAKEPLHKVRAPQRCPLRSRISAVK